MRSDSERAAVTRLEAVLEAVSDGFYAVDRGWRITMFNRAAEAYFGLDRNDVIGRNLWDLFPQGLGQPYEHYCRLAMDDGQVSTFQAPSGLRPGRTVELRIAPMPGEGIAVSLTDITERRAAEERQRLLVNELNHRVKNTLASVQSIAGQTARRATGIAQFQESFEGRLLALSRAHDVLTRQSWDKADLAEMVHKVLAPLHPGDRLAVSGPSVRLSPGQALAFAMAFHELATNAAKYGAWSVGAGRVNVDWSVEGERLRVVWREEGGPPVTPPDREGFGSRLLRQGLVRELAGSVDLTFPAEGALCVIEAPLESRG
ncbi:sensor histidine kinase [Phenylobacterium sp. J367]|uniref:sensor histidine kinase n=1 Tax=Phenylobacterium sp. J367 TaxID=2898435 RepID=UPI0021516753|nr:HWE histidine kinase domain-containing protein [Phenylobacterium sp. J367]MCR5879404.1 PAS domain-containing protein [Phenylobacterium sp. J367]